MKLFAFGQGHKKIFAFQKKIEEDSESNIDDEEMKGGQYQNEVVVVSRPTAIKFPKHTKPIVAVACGSAHVLAINEQHEMFSWGFGQYGALGFGTRDDIWEPRRLIIKR